MSEQLAELRRRFTAGTGQPGKAPGRSFGLKTCSAANGNYHISRTCRPEQLSSVALRLPKRAVPFNALFC